MQLFSADAKIFFKKISKFFLTPKTPKPQNPKTPREAEILVINKIENVRGI